MRNLVVPSARLGIVRQCGVLLTPDGRPGIEVVAVDHRVLVHIWRHVTGTDGRVSSEKFYTIELPSESAAHLAEALHRSSVITSRSGDSPSPERVIPTLIQ